MNSKTYVCTTCSQDFTRKYSAHRHSRDLHHGQGKIVRMIDYVIGRISGEYHPGNPLSHRSRHKQHSSTTPHSDAKAYGFPISSIAHDNNSQKVFSDTPLETEAYGPIGRSENNSAESLPASNNSRSISKFERIRKLSQALSPTQSTEIFLKNLSLRIIEGGGNEGILDDCLKVLQNRTNVMEAYHYLLDASTNEAYSFTRAPLHNHHVGHLPESSRTKLAQIEQMLTRTKHEAYVWEDIKQLINRCESTGDHTFLDRELEFHKMNRFKT